MKCFGGGRPPKETERKRGRRPAQASDSFSALGNTFQEKKQRHKKNFERELKKHTGFMASAKFKDYQPLLTALFNNNQETTRQALEALNEAQIQKFLNAVTQHNLKNPHEEIINQQDATTFVKRDAMLLRYLPSNLKNDLTVVLAAVAKNGCALQYAPRELKANKDVVLAAVAENGFSLRYALYPSRDDRDIVLEALNHCGYECDSLSVSASMEKVIQNMDFYKTSEGTELDKFKATLNKLGDREFVLAAVANDESVLKYASKELQSDREIRMAAYKSYTRGHWSTIKVTGRSKVPDLKAKALIKRFSTEALDPELQEKFKSFTPKEKQDFITQSLTFLDLNNSTNEIFGSVWLCTMQGLMNLEGEQKRVFDRFVELVLAMSVNGVNGYGVSTDVLVDHMWNDASKECLISPDMPGHFLYVHTKKMDANTVTFTIGNTGQGVQGMDQSGKADLLKRYTVKRRVVGPKGKKEDDERFKARITSMMERLQKSQDRNGKTACDANIFMTQIVPDVFGNIQAQNVSDKRKLQSVGNCALKGLTKNFLFQVCDDMGCRALYYKLTEKMCDALMPLFNDGDPESRKVFERINQKRANLVMKPIPALLRAVKEGNQGRVTTLIAAGAAVDVKDVKGYTPLHYAVERGDKDLVEQLIAAGAAVDVKDGEGQTPLHRVEDIEVAKQLIVAGANLNAKNNRDQTPLHYTVYYGNKDIVKLLLATKAAVDVKDVAGSTPLHYAVERGDKDLVEQLIAAGAAVDVKDVYGHNPFHYAVKRGNKDIANLLFSRKPPPIQSKLNKTPPPIQLKTSKGNPPPIQSKLNKTPPPIQSKTSKRNPPPIPQTNRKKEA